MPHSFLRANTAAQARIIGPFIDDVDFKTVETGLTIANTDIKVQKNGAVAVNKNSGGATARANGDYLVTWDDTDTDTVGELEITVLVSGALVVKRTYYVLEETAFDTLYATLPTIMTPPDVGLLVETTVDAVTTDVDFTIIAGIVDDATFIGQIMTIKETATGQLWTTYITSTTFASQQVISEPNPNLVETIPFTVVAGDEVRIFQDLHAMFAFVQFDPPTRFELTTDTNSILQKIINMFKLAFRNDTASVIDQAVEIAEINSNVTQGGGSFDPVDASTMALNVQHIATDARIPTALSSAGNMKADILEVNDITLQGDGSTANPWRPV